MHFCSNVTGAHYFSLAFLLFCPAVDRQQSAAVFAHHCICLFMCTSRLPGFLSVLHDQQRITDFSCPCRFQTLIGKGSKGFNNKQIRKLITQLTTVTPKTNNLVNKYINIILLYLLGSNYSHWPSRGFISSYSLLILTAHSCDYSFLIFSSQ